MSPFFDTLLFNACVLLIGVFLSSCSQVMLKKAATREYPSRVREYLNPLVIGAYAVFILTTFLCVLAYRVVPLSMGPVLESTSYIYITIFGLIFFGERITWKKVLALVIIVAGIVIYSLGV